MTSRLEDFLSHPLWVSAADGLAVVAEDGTMLAVNKPFEQLFGYDQADLVGKPVEILVPETDRDAHLDQRRRYGAKPQTRLMGASRLLEGRKRTGEQFALTIALSPVMIDDAQVTIVGVRDMTGRLAVEAERAEAQRRRMQAEDHDRIAKELHDSVIQQLFALGLRLQGLPARVSDEFVAGAIEESVDAIDSVIGELRTAIYGLRTPVEPDRRVRAKVLDVVAEMEHVLPEPPTVRFEGPGTQSVDGAVLAALLPSLREALANVGRHAEADHVTVLVSVGDEVLFEVADDGIGLPGDVERSGLAHLEARAKVLGGTLQTEPNEPHGLILRWRVPNADAAG